MRIQWTVLPIPKMFDNFVNKLGNLENKDSHIVQNPVFTRCDSGIDEAVIFVEEEKQSSIPEEMEVPDRTPTKGQQIADNLVEEYVDKALMTPHKTFEA